MFCPTPLLFARVGAIVVLKASAHVVLALADELRIQRTMDGAAIDLVIERAVAMQALKIEHQRRNDWRRRAVSAAAPVRNHGLLSNREQTQSFVVPRVHSGL